MDQRPDDIGPQRREDDINGLALGMKGILKEGNSPQSKPERLRTSIQETETRLTHTINAIQERLSVEHILRLADERLQQVLSGRIGDMKTSIERMSGRIGESTLKAIKENPFPVALFGLGIGWILMENLRGQPARESQSRVTYIGLGSEDSDAMVQAGMEEFGAGEYRQGETSSEHGIASSAVRKTKEAAGGIHERAGEIAEHIKESAGHFAETAHSKVHTARGSLSRMVEEKPIAVGFAGVAIGALLGFALAGSLKDRGVFSGARDTLRHRLKEVLHETKEKTERVVDEPRSAARDEAEREHLTTTTH